MLIFYCFDLKYHLKYCSSNSYLSHSSSPAPISVPPPNAVESINGFSAAVNWLPPTDNRGPIDRYELKAYNRDSPEVLPVQASYPADGNFTGKTLILRSHLFWLPAYSYAHLCRLTCHPMSKLFVKIKTFRLCSAVHTSFYYFNFLFKICQITWLQRSLNLIW